MQTLSIIVVTLNEAQHIPRLKASIDRLTRPDNLAIETVLIDGGSTDGTYQIATEKGFSKVLVLPSASIPACRNAGIEEASGNWLAFADGDCEITEEWLLNAWPLMDLDQAVILGWPAAPPYPRTWVQDNWWFHWNNKNPATTEVKNSTSCVKKEAFRLITTRNMLLNREAYDLVDGFNEDLPTGEDTDFVFRATLAGAEVLAVPSMKVYHYGEPATLRTFFKQQLWHANRNSYGHIARQHGRKIGANAPRFTYCFLAVTLLAVAAALVATFAGVLFLVGCLPLIAVIALPALQTCYKGWDIKPFLPLCIIYIVYGLARSIDLLGLNTKKTSWKSLKR